MKEDFIMENEYLNEEKYRKAEKMITLVANLVLLAGLSLGGFLIYRGVVKPDKARLLDLKTINISLNLFQFNLIIIT